MAHIEISRHPSRAHENIFTIPLEITPTIKDTIIRTIKDGGDKQNRESNVKASMTDWHMQEEPGFTELEGEIHSIINYLPNIIDKHGYQGGMEAQEMWGMVYKKNDYTTVHNHWPSIWSGVFYLDIPTDYAGTLFFPDLEHKIEPITGQLVIFSGSTMHGVETIKSNSDRLAVSFNYGESNG